MMCPSRTAALALLAVAACASPPAPTTTLAPSRAATIPGEPRTVWTRRFGSPGDQEPSSVAVDSKGNIAIVGSYEGPFDPGAGPLPVAGHSHGQFVALLDEGGRARWSRPFGGPGAIGHSLVAFDSADRIVVGGEVWPREGGHRIFTAGVLDPSGKPIWNRRFGGSALSTLSALAVDARGDLILVGRYSKGSLDLGNGPMPYEGETDAFVLALDARGELRWTKRYGGAGRDLAQAVAFDAKGDAIVVGLFDGTVDFGSGPLVSAGEEDVFVTKLDRAGRCVWARRFGGPGDEFVGGVAVDHAGNIAVTGGMLDVMDVGGQKLVSAGSADVFVVVLDPSGEVRWARRFGDPGVQGGGSAAFDGAGDVIISGTMKGTVDFGHGPRAISGDGGNFVAAFTGAGAPLWSVVYPDVVQVEGVHVAVDRRNDDVLFTGIARGARERVDGLAVPGDDVFAVKLAR